MRTSPFAILVLTGVPVVAAGCWAMVRSCRRISARKGAAGGNADRRADRDHRSATGGPGEALRCPPAPPSRGGRPQRDGGWTPGLDDMHLWLGAYVLEALDATDTRTVQRHLSGCWTCRAELVEFTVLLELLGRLTAEDVIVGPHADHLHDQRPTVRRRERPHQARPDAPRRLAHSSSRTSWFFRSGPESAAATPLRPTGCDKTSRSPRCGRADGSRSRFGADRKR